MGHESLVYGRVRGSVLRPSGPHYFDLHAHDRAVIDRISADDDWPFFTRSMFCVRGAAPERGRYRTQVIHLGASLERVECEWGEWLSKVEALLARLYLDDAVVHLETEFLGEFAYRWTALDEDRAVVDARIAARNAGPRVPWPTLPRSWHFDGGPRRFAC